MIHRWKQALCVLLSLVLMLQLVQPALAVWQKDAPTEAQSPDQVVLKDAEGNETRPDKSWEETYPYGAFAFDQTAADVKEGDDTVITVYRAGGTAGRATAYITYSPLLVPNEDGSTYYGYALSGKDLTLEVEDPLPIAQYQPVGKDPDPEPGEATVRKSTDDQGYVLTLSREADSYQWEIFCNDAWCAIGDSDQQAIPLDAEYLDDGMDYRCVYTVDGVRYCTDSLKGVAYEKPEPEALAPIPEDIELNPAPTYTAIDLDDEDDPYSGWVFGLTFAEGEWKKEIHFHANTDDAAEAMEGATIRIAYTEGGEICQGSDTLLYHVQDRNESTPSTVGFSLKQVNADKADGTVEVLVTREGGFERPVTVEYRTADGTAKAGTDYVAASGTLMFYGNVTELPVTVELIDDQEKSDQPLDFSIELSDLKGDDNCAMAEDTATVTLTNSGTGDASNLASRLYDSEAVDVSASVKDSPTAANAGSDPAVGEQVETEEPQWEPLDLVPEGGGLSTQSHQFSDDKALIQFGGHGKWTATADLAVRDTFDSASNNNVTVYTGTQTIKNVGNKVGTDGKESTQIRFTEYKLEGGVALAGKSNGHISMKTSIEKDIGQLYSNYSAKITAIYSHDETRLGGAEWHSSWLNPMIYIYSNQKDGKISVEEPADTDYTVYEGDRTGTYRSAGATNWNVRGKTSGESSSAYANPYNHTYSGTIPQTGKVEISLELVYDEHYNYDTDDMKNKSLIYLRELEMTRRFFQKDAFSVDIATPNDDNTAPSGCMKISDYKNYLPQIYLLDQGGATGSNQVYVGSTVQVVPNQNLPAGLSIHRVDVLSSDDGGKTWTTFTKFRSNHTGNTWTFTLLGDPGNELTKDEISNTKYKFRVVYQRENTVKVDLTPSLPRDGDGNVQTDQVAQLFDNYKTKNPETGIIEETQDHCFGTANIKYGYSTFNDDASVLDFKDTITEKKNIKPAVSGVAPGAASNTLVWTLPKDDSTTADGKVTNIQWINFGLPEGDLLLLNGTAYKGNSTIYFTEEELAGDIVIKYYHSAYQSYINAMTADISWMGLYLDGDGDGKINGTYENGAFKLPDDSKDRFIRYLRTGESFNEMEVAPELIGDNGKRGQYFVQVCYSMTPRCLTVPEGANENDKAQVLSAITTAVDPASTAYSEQTPEQKKYNYVVSGKDSTGKYTSDDHLMYKEKASAKTVLSFPLGGDQTPVKIGKDKNDQPTYSWTPTWFENNLYSYQHPDLITIKNSLAGKTKVTAGAKMDKTTKQYTYSDPALKQMNGYLASLTGTSTFVLVSQIQQAGTDDIKAAPGTYPVVPDSVTMSQVSTSPDASYLQHMKDAGGSSEATMPTSDDGSELQEFSMDFDLNLGGNEIAITDYVTILLDENQVGFAVSLPLAAFEKEGTTTGGWEDGEGKRFVEHNQDAWTQFGEFFHGGKNLGDKTLEDSRGTNAKGVKSGKFSVSLSASAAFLWKYNPLDNGYYFSAWEIGLQGELEFRIQARLTPCPVFYAFLDISFSLEAKTGLGVIRDSKNGDAIIDAKTAGTAANAKKRYHFPAAIQTIDEKAYKALKPEQQSKYVEYGGGYAKKDECLATQDYFLTVAQYDLLSADEQTKFMSANDNEYYYNNKYTSLKAAQESQRASTNFEFTLDQKAFDIRFNGKLYVEVLVKEGNDWVDAPEPSDDDPGYVSGTISSDGRADTQVVLRQQDEMDLEKPVKVILWAMNYDDETAVDETEITYLAPVTGIYNQVHWNGISIAPELGIEVGVGVGVELLKAEIYLHISLGAEFLLWGYNELYDPKIPERDPNYQKEYYCRVESFDFSIGIAMRVVLVFFTYEMEFASYQVSFASDGINWEDGEPFKHGEWSHEWHFLNDLVENGADDSDAGVTVRLPANTSSTQKVYSPEDNAESELSTQAYNPTDATVPFQTSGYGSSMDAANLTTGIPAGSQYKVIRAGSKNYVVYTLSRAGENIAPEDRSMLVLSELGYNDNNYGLVNPVNSANATKYIVLDTEDNPTGDLDFDVWVEQGSPTTSEGVTATTYTIHAAWVSYATQTVNQTEPAKPDGAVYSSGGTAMDANNYQTISAPTTVPQPVASDYYTATDPGTETGWTKDGESETWYKSSYGSLSAAQTAYDTALVAYNAYASQFKSYQEWKAYYAGLASYNAFVANRAKAAAENTVVKTAAWSYTETTSETTTYEYSPSFSDPVALPDSITVDSTTTAYNYLFQPASAGDGSAIFFGSTYAGDDGNAAITAYKSFIDKKFTNEQNNQKVKNYLTTMKQSNLDILGTRSALNLAVKNGNDWTISQQVIGTDQSPNQTLANVEFTAAGTNSYYVAYTTEQTEYEKNGDTITDMVTVYRLYLRTVTVDNTGTAIWGTPYLIRELRDFDLNKAGKDGVYSGGTLMPGKEYDSPYLANLKFLNAKLDATALTGGEELSTQAVTDAPQTILVFEMNGASYIIPESTLASITNQQGGLIYPFFTPPMHTNTYDVGDGTNEVPATVQEGSSGKLNVDINTDAKGNLYAVYVGAAEGTTGNALYLSTYDTTKDPDGKVIGWGDGVMLAMHDMDVYEAAIREDWDQSTRELAYLYRNDTIRAKEDSLKAMYGEEALNTVKDVYAAEAAQQDRTQFSTGDGKTFTFTDVQTVMGAKGDLLAITQGTTRTMTIEDYQTTGNTPVTKYVLGPKYTTGGVMDSTQGTYAVSFGQGSAALGKGAISFAQQDFGQGSRLYVDIQAENVGTSAIRGSETQPITATLNVVQGGTTQELANWQIKENVISGQTVALSGYCSPLATDLKSGDTFTLTLAEYTKEGTTYDGSSYDITLFTVEEKPDLSVENLTITPASIKNDGANTVLSVDFVAANQGSAEAENVYAQFSYVSGYDKDDQPIYSPLDLTTNDLKIGMQESLGSLLTTQGIDKTLENGILYLISSEEAGTESGNSNLRAGCGKRVSGTITVPSAVFAAGESRHAEIKVELFSDASSMTTQDLAVITASHDEYYTANNAVTKQVEALTSFAAPHAVIIPLGSTTKIPITAVSARNTKPVLSLEEIGDEDGQNIGILNFKQSVSDGGKVSGVLSLTPLVSGTGTLHVTDTDTNTTYSIAFEVTPDTKGIDIYRDNDAFTFYNADGKRYDESAAAGTQSWAFSGAPSWGTEGENGTAEAPMRQNLSIGDKGAKFTFDTVAESIDLYFQGTVTVTSTNPDFAKQNAGKTSVTLTNTTGGNAPTEGIKLGNNEENAIYIVTVTVQSGTASFDRLEEHYAGGQVPVPAYDGESPLFIWSRSFPDTGSISESSKTEIPLKVYVLDNNGVASLTVNTDQITDPDLQGDAVESLDPNQLLWCYDFGTIAKNGNYTITAADVSGNLTSTVLQVDWFLEDGKDPHDTIHVPPYTADFYQNSEKVSGTISSTEGLAIQFAADTMDENAPKLNNNTFEVYYFDGTDFQKQSGLETNAPVSISKNGLYWTRTINKGTTDEPDDDTWSAQVINLTQIDGNVPQASLTFNGNLQAPALLWSAGKTTSSAAQIKTVTINGAQVNTEAGKSLSGQMPIRYNGKYSLYAEDTASPALTAGLDVPVSDLRLTEPENLVAEVIDAWNQAKDNGSISVDLSGLTGGTYDSAKSVPAENAYVGKYKVLLLDPENTDGIADVITTLGTDTNWVTLDSERYTRTWTDLTPGDYRLLIVDAGDGGITVKDSEGQDTAYTGDPTNNLLKTITVKDNALTISAVTQNAAGSQSNGTVVLTTKGGTAEQLEFAILPAPEGYRDGQDMTIDQFMAFMAQTEDAAWTLGDENGTCTISDLPGGNYYVAARGVYADLDSAAIRDAKAKMDKEKAEVDAKDAAVALAQTELETAQADLVQMQAALKDEAPANDPTQEQIDAQKQAVSNAKEALDAAKEAAESAQATHAEAKAAYEKAITDASAAYYSDSANADQLTGALVKFVSIEVTSASSGGSSSASAIEKIFANENGDVEITLKDGVSMTEADMAKLREANEDNDLLLTNSSLTAMIPEDTLATPDFDLNRLIADTAEAKDGMVVEYTDLEGNTRIDAFGIVTDGEADYIVLAEGDYRIVPAEAAFSDIAGLWGEADILFAAYRGLVNGTGDGQFSPQVTMSRAMFVTVLWRMSASQTPGAEAAFRDLTSDWYKESVAWAVENGIVTGYSDAEFGPNDPVTREQMCVLMIRYLDYLGWTLDKTNPAIDFADADQISAWAADAVKDCTQMGLINGVGDDMVAPKKNATRMEASAILTRFIKAIVEQYCG